MIHPSTTSASPITRVPPSIVRLGVARRDGSHLPAVDDDDQLVVAARAGHLDAFNTLVGRHESAAFGLAAQLLGDHAAAEDITQESMFAAWSNLASYRGGRFRSWLLRIVANRCVDELRRRRRHRVASLDQLPVEPVGDWALRTAAEAPDAYALRHELSRHLRHAIAALPADLRLILILADVRGYGYAEIATIVGVNLGTVKSRLSRARARLRDHHRRYLRAS